MRTLNVELGARSYPLRIGAGLLSEREQFAEIANRKVRIVTDANAGRRYLPALLSTLSLTTEDVLVLPAGETQKTWATAEKILDWLLANNFGRDGVLIALGGGV